MQRTSWGDAGDGDDAMVPTVEGEGGEVLPSPPRADDWSKAETIVEVEEVDGVRFKVVKQKRKFDIRRPFTMVDQRAQWARFGEGKTVQKDLVALDPMVVLELGTIDPLEKQCRDEVTRMWGDVERMSVTVKDPGLQRYVQLLASGHHEAAKQDAAAPAVTTSTDDSKPLTWGQANKEKKESVPTDRAKDSGEKLTKNVVRISNLSDLISEGELRRLFGPENNLPAIVKVFIALDKETRQRRGFAYITYRTDADGELVVSRMGRTPFKNTILKVDFGTDKK